MRTAAVDVGFDFGRFRSDCQFGVFDIGVEAEAAARLSGNEEFSEGETVAGNAAGGTLQRQGERSVGVGLVGDTGAGRLTGEQPRGLAWRRAERRVFHGKPAAVADGKLRVKFRHPFDLIALGTTELKQKKAAGVGSDDLYQLKYTPLDSNQ